MYELRQLKSDDIFLVSAILSKIGLKDIKNAIDPSMFEGENATAIGFNIVMEIAESVMKNLPACKNELYTFLNSVAGVDCAELSMGEFAELVVEVIQKDDFRDFFKAVAKLFK